mgnify:CR=1 FL=1
MDQIKDLLFCIKSQVVNYTLQCSSLRESLCVTPFFLQKTTNVTYLFQILQLLEILTALSFLFKLPAASIDSTQLTTPDG